jgi:hypothetical protein
LGNNDIIHYILHPFYVKGRGWVAAGDLNEGDELCLESGETAYVTGTELEKLAEPITVYNLEVADFNTYFVGDNAVLVHNYPGSDGDEAPPKLKVKENGVTIESYYPKDHGNPVHMHVTGNGPKTKIGPNGKPLSGYPDLTPQQAKVVERNIDQIQKVFKQLQKWVRKQPYGSIPW